MSAGGLLEGAVDVHLHSAPDVVPRRYSDVEVARRAKLAGLGGIVLKCHHESTVGRAAAASAATGFNVYGGIVLNRWYSGGVEVRTVAASLELGARVVWWPTVTSAAHLAHYEGKRTSPARHGRAVKAICREIAAHDAVLATGHADPSTIDALADAAAVAGARMLLTHADFVIPNLGVSAQVRLAEYPNLWFERCAYTLFADPDPGRMSARMVEAIEATGGPARNILSSDLGQPLLPDYPAGLETFATALIRSGLKPCAARRMLVDSPLELLGRAR